MSNLPGGSDRGSRPLPSGTPSIASSARADPLCARPGTPGGPVALDQRIDPGGGASHPLSVPSRHGPAATSGSPFESGVAPRFAGGPESPRMSRLANLGDDSGVEKNVGLLRVPCPRWPAPICCRFTLEGEERKGTLGVKATSKAPTSRRTVQDSAKTGKVSRAEATKAAKKVTQKSAAAAGR